MLNNVISDPLLGRFTVRGWYSVGAVSGAVAGSVAGNGQLFSMLWADSTYSALVSRITVAAKCEAFSSGTGADFQAIIGRASTAAPSGGTAIVPGSSTACQALSSQDYPASLFNSEGDMRIASTAALTAGTITLDTTGIGYAAVPGNAVGVGGTFDLYRWGVHPARPLVLANNEALIIRTPGGWPASNTWRVGVTVEWAEVKAGG
jgi:hypothetical protein